MDSHTLASFNSIVLRKVNLNYSILGYCPDRIEARCQTI